MRPSICRLLAPLVLTAVSLAPLPAADAPPPRALPLNAPAPTPSLVNVTTYTFRDDSGDHKVIVTTSPTLQRFDLPDDRYSIIYDPSTQFYTGLEHGNYTYWTFSWPEVRAAVEASQRGEKRLQDLAGLGLNPDSTTPASSPPPSATTDPTSSLATGDDSGYVWKQTGEKKRIADLPCEHWTGETVSGENCDVWCYNGPLPGVSEAIARLREVDEPVALVPLRTIVPDFIFPVYDSLQKAGITPVQINWGGDTDKGMFRLVAQKTARYEAKFFAPPRLYNKTTLITLDGMIPEQPMPGQRGTPVAPRVDHLTPTPNPRQTVPPQ